MCLETALFCVILLVLFTMAKLVVHKTLITYMAQYKNTDTEVEYVF